MDLKILAIIVNGINRFCVDFCVDLRLFYFFEKFFFFQKNFEIRTVSNENYLKCELRVVTSDYIISL